MTQIDWIPPKPRPGLSGAWDQFVGPGATRREEWLQLLGGLALTAALLLLLYLQGHFGQWSTLQIIVVVLLAFDLFGGVITNATTAAKRWYHRAGQEGVRAHLPFIAVHGLHLLVIALLFRQADWAYVGVLYGYLLLAAVIIIRTPLYLQRPLAMTFFCGSLLLGMYALPPAPGLEWFVPLFYLKLLISHLVKEAPFAP
ncbi:MAG: hypothetical protein SF123_24335 [Chloroflexota bacterium]|nr:hypothetical protein [Chloroflexota bacterium]